MNVTVIVATFGDEEWERRGKQAAEKAADQRGCDVWAVHDRDATLAQVRNACAASARGDWLCFLDADDELAPGYLDAMRRAWTEGAITTDWAPLLVPAIEYVPAGPEPVEVPAWGRSIYDLNCACVGTLVRRELFLDHGGFGEEPIYEDWALWLRLVAAGVRMVDVPDAVYRYHVLAGSLRNQRRPEAVRTYAAIRARYADVPNDVWEGAKCR